MYKVRDAKGGVPSKEMGKLLVGDPLGFFTFVEQGAPPTTLESDWWMRSFRHRLFIFVGTLQHKDGGQGFVDRNVSWTTTQVVRFSRNTELEIDSESARFLDEVLVPFLLNALGLAMDPTVPIDTWLEKMAKEG